MPNRYRLSRAIEPVFYAITLRPDLRRFTFEGSEAVSLIAHGSFSTITLHALELKITRAALRAGKNTFPARHITYDRQFETATLHFSRSFPKGTRCALELGFTGTINDKMHGFYRTSYAVKSEKHWGAATQFEATDARRAFPCWDEPDRKAHFQLTLQVPKQLTALSNMPVQQQRLLGKTGLKEITYQPTVRMSTYLLAWVIAELECVSGRDKNGVAVRIWTTPGKKNQGRFALQTGCRSLEYFAQWFGIPYALPKLDMVACPDFASGAMENWGLVTYRETALLVDAKNSSASARQRVAQVVAHELAHQWFGNLVTMEWWTDLWLNEGFASYMDPKSIDRQFPRWKVWSQFVAGEYLHALADDSLKNTHPIEIPIQNPAEIREIFDAITYSKGSSVNRMLEHYLTEPVFRKGLSRYLKRYAYKNARTNDLWTELERVSGKPVRKIMAAFTRKGGYPVIEAAIAGKNRIRLSQRRFLIDGSRPKNSGRWCVPIVAAVGGRKQPYYGLLKTARGGLSLPTGGWVKVNAGHSGFYRTRYSPELFSRLVAAADKGDLSAIDCLGLLDDTLALARAGLMRTSQALQLASKTGRNSDYNVWLTLAGLLGTVERLLDNDAARQRLFALGRKLFFVPYFWLSWQPRKTEGHLDALLRSLAIGRLSHFGDPKIIAEARKRFAGFCAGAALPPDLRGPVYAAVARYGSDKEYAQLLGIYRRSQLQEERVRVLRALTQFRKPALIEKALRLSLSGEIRRQDAYMILGGFGGNPAGRLLAWKFVKKHWKALIERFSDGGLRMMTHIIEGSAGGFTDDAGLADISRWFKRHPVAGAGRTIKQTIESVATNVRWRKRDGADIRRWLSQSSH